MNGQISQSMKTKPWKDIYTVRCNAWSIVRMGLRSHLHAIAFTDVRLNPKFALLFSRTDGGGMDNVSADELVLLWLTNVRIEATKINVALSYQMKLVYFRNMNYQTHFYISPINKL